MAPSESPPKPLHVVKCPGCGEQLEVLEEHVGRRGKCTQCGRQFRIGGHPAPPAPSAPASSIFDDEDKPQVHTFACSLCESRITVRVADVGKKVKCPDCGRPNVIPPPPAARLAPAPAAMEGDQFELWGVDENPSSELLQQYSPRLHPIECRVCQTLMYANEKQLGAKLKCPDCGALTVAKAAPPPKPKRPPLASPGAEYELDESSAPTPRYVPVPFAIRDAQLHEAARATTVGPDGRLIVKKDQYQERPVRPAVPLVEGVWRMIFTQEVLAPWVLVSILFGGAAWFLIDSLNTPVQSIAAIAGIFLMLIAVGLTVLWISFAAPLFLAILTESSDGSDRLHDPPKWSAFDWFGEAGYLLMPTVAAAAPGFLLWRFGGAAPVEAQVAIGAAAAVVIFPLALMGALLESSMFGIISPRLLTTLARQPGPWMLFYMETAALVAGAGLAVWAIAVAAPAALAAIPFIAMGVAVIYMRLLGRLGWWLADSMPDEDDEDEDED